jgi:hypothetical protein
MGAGILRTVTAVAGAVKELVFKVASVKVVGLGTSVIVNSIPPIWSMLVVFVKRTLSPIRYP